MEITEYILYNENNEEEFKTTDINKLNTYMLFNGIEYNFRNLQYEYQDEKCISVTIGFNTGHVLCFFVETIE